ncbi:MAG: hypothetical protein SOT46_05295 [Treponema sp.]|nr:hypothetical protein [Treponema sp.]
MGYAFSIQELELSINNTCNLCCSECGFLIPHQPKPTLTENILQEHCKSLEILRKNNIEIKSLAILGGEPTLNVSFLEKATEAFSFFENIRRLEVVTNGLNPKGLSQKTLDLIQKISISVYKDDVEFVKSWKNFLKRKAPHIETAFRIQKIWDINTGDFFVSDDEAQKLFDSCWYKRHCTTIERSKLFVCSIAPKHKSDADGLLLTESITQNEIVEYLTRTVAISHCKRCIPEMHIKKVQGGIQQDKRDLSKMMENAKLYLNSAD